MNIKMTRCQRILEQEVNPNLLQDYWCQLRCSGPDIFVITKFDGSNNHTLQNGWMPEAKDSSIEELRECVRELESLKEFVESASKEAFTKIKRIRDFHEVRCADRHSFCIYSKCKDGVIGVGWRFRDGDLAKAKMMATFTLYSFGLINCDADKVLWEAAYKHLPFATGMNLTLADQVFIKHAL